MTAATEPGFAKSPRPLRMVFVCQAVDGDDPVLAGTLRWIEAFARSDRVDRVAALALRTGRFDLPSNVEVECFGRAGRVRTLLAFYAALGRVLRPRPDFFLVYQGGPYPALLLPFRLLLRAPVAQWKAHPVITRTMAFYARWCDDLVLTSASTAFPMAIDKVRVVGQGIDVERFKPERHPALGDLISVGRITPRKRIEQAIEAVVAAGRRGGAEYRLNVYGPVMPGDEGHLAELRETIDRLGATDRVAIHGPVPQADLPALLNGHRAYLNLSETAIDRAAVEAMACGLPVVSSNDSIREMLPADLRPLLMTDKHSLDAQVESLRAVLEMPAEEREDLRLRMRELVVQTHSIELLVGRILDQIEPLTGAARRMAGGRDGAERGGGR